MVLRDKILHVFDIETVVNCFLVSTINSETQEVQVFEISSRRNDIKQIYDKFNTKDTYFVGYNNIQFDTQVLLHIINLYLQDNNIEWSTLTNQAYDIADKFIHDEEYRFAHSIRNTLYNEIDLLTMLYSKKLRVSLKWLQVTMHYDNVLEMDIDWGQYMDEKDIDRLINYNINDIKSTLFLLQKVEKDLLLRIEAEDRYDISCLSKDGINLSKAILAKEYSNATGYSTKVLKELVPPAKPVVVKDIILPFIKLESKEFRTIYDNLCLQTINDGIGVLNYETIYNNLKYSVGVGGLHSINKPIIVEPKEDEVLVDADINSMYPSIIIAHKCYPRHLGVEFENLYHQIRDERIDAKRKGDKLRDATMKLMLNGISGLLGEENSWLYDTNSVLKLRINGQLMMLMLIEHVTNAGMNVISANTDGITVLMKKDKYDKYLEICTEWEKLTQLTLEHVEYEKIIMRAVNDYMAIKKGKENTNEKQIKYKGSFLQEITMGKGLFATIIPIALKNYFVYKIPVKDTIMSCNDIKAFLIGEKTGKMWEVYYNNQKIQRINRYYVSKKGHYLDKKKTTGMLYRMCNKPVIVYNKFTHKPISEYDIDYTYYINECNKIIEEIEPRQLSIF